MGARQHWGFASKGRKGPRLFFLFVCLFLRLFCCCCCLDRRRRDSVGETVVLLDDKQFREVFGRRLHLLFFFTDRLLLFLARFFPRFYFLRVAPFVLRYPQMRNYEKETLKQQ